MSDLLQRLADAGPKGLLIADKSEDAKQAHVLRRQGFAYYKGSWADIWGSSTQWYITAAGIAFLEAPAPPPVDAGEVDPAPAPEPVPADTGTPADEVPAEEQDAPPAPEPEPEPNDASLGDEGTGQAAGDQLDAEESGDPSPAPVPEVPAVDPPASEGQVSGDQPPAEAPVLDDGMEAMIKAFLDHECGADEMRAGAQRLATEARQRRAEPFTGRKRMRFTKRNARLWARSMDRYQLAGVDEDPAP